MDPKRAQTLEALEAFIRNQRSLLAHTQSDIKRLEELRKTAISNSSSFSSPLDLQDGAFGLSRLSDARLTLPNDIDWSLFEAHDPRPFQTLALEARQKYASRNQPHTYQRSDLSDLQKLVKDARRTIVDPVLSLFEYLSDPDSELEEKPSPEEARREREREKLRQLKKRKIRMPWGGLGLPASHHTTQLGVYIRHDLEDESQDVDVTLDDDDNDKGPNGGKKSPSELTFGDFEGSGGTISATSRSTPSINQRPGRVRRPSHKYQLSQSRAGVPSKRKHSTTLNTTEDSPPLKISNSNPRVEAGNKPKSETYKQAWSVSEQHLLEQLLEQIPEGEKNRWQKISRAMNGKRTPRQVASRVQKYFEKLKKFGIGER